MSLQETFYWYDLETFGIVPQYDRIAQFAGKRTTLNFEQIGDPDIIYVKLSGDYIPDPSSCIVTGIIPQFVKKNGIPENEAAEKIFNIFSSKPNTCVCGYNSISFDDEFIRNIFYRNFIDPYVREYANNCSRWDIIDLVRAAHDLRPDGIMWPINDQGKPSFKLTDLTKINKIEHINAHDALSDVDATIAIAKLIKEKQPALFDYFYKLKSKNYTTNILRKSLNSLEPLIHVNKTYTSENGCTGIIIPLCTNTSVSNAFWCFSLDKDPANLLLDSKNCDYPPGLFSFSTNKSQFISNIKTIDENTQIRLGLNMPLYLKHLDYIKEHINEIKDAILKRENDEKKEYVASDPDLAIYSDFFGSADRELFKLLRNTPPNQKLNLNFNFVDKRCNEMLYRYVCRNYYSVLTAKEKKKWKEFCAQRLFHPPDIKGSRTINSVKAELEAYINDENVSDKDKKIYKSVLSYVEDLYKFIST